jgi:hypothetical protein
MITQCELSEPVQIGENDFGTTAFSKMACTSTDGIFATTTEAGVEQYAFEYKGATSTPFYYRNFWTGADVVIVMLLGFICFITIMTILVKAFLRFKTGIHRKGQ